MTDPRLWRSRFSSAVDGLCARIGLSCGRYVHGDFTQQRRSFGKSPTERPDKGVVAFGAFGSGGRLGLLRQCRRRRKPEADEEREGLNRYPDIALEPLHLPGQPIESSRKRCFLPLGGIGG